MALKIHLHKKNNQMEKKEKLFAVKAFIKPKPTNGQSWKGKSFKGIALGASNAEAKQKTIEYLATHIEAKTEITKDDISITECKLYSDFTVK